MEKEDGRAMGSAVCSIELTFVTQKMPLLHRTLPSLHVLFGRAEVAVSRIYNNYVLNIIDIQNNGIHIRQLDESTCNESQFDANNSEFV